MPSLVQSSLRAALRCWGSLVSFHSLLLGIAGLGGLHMPLRARELERGRQLGVCELPRMRSEGNKRTPTAIVMDWDGDWGLVGVEEGEVEVLRQSSEQRRQGFDWSVIPSQAASIPNIGSQLIAHSVHFSAPAPISLPLYYIHIHTYTYRYHVDSRLVSFHLIFLFNICTVY